MGQPAAFGFTNKNHRSIRRSGQGHPGIMIWSNLFLCRLVPLKKKDNGIRPVGVGECLPRIISKTITTLLKEDRSVQREHYRHVPD